MTGGSHADARAQLPPFLAGLSLRGIHSGYGELALARRGRPARKAAAPRPAAEVWMNSRRLTRILGLLLRDLEAESTLATERTEPYRCCDLLPEWPDCAR